VNKTRLSALLLLVTASCQPSRPVADDEPNERDPRAQFERKIVTDCRFLSGNQNVRDTAGAGKTSQRTTMIYTDLIAAT